ncbi:MAG TPA: ABC transporter permease [Pseudoxanthomonas sp.]|nr:ABC transporter permease [Pseudoxanthomonas sp.]
MLQRLQTLVRKELQALLRDPNSRRLLILPVLLQIVLFPFAATLDVRNARIAVRDGGPTSAEIVQRLSASSAFSEVRILKSDGEAREVLDRSESLLVVSFMPGFSRDVAAQRPATVQVLIDGRHANSGQLAFGYVQGVVGASQAETAGAGASGPRLSVTTTEVRHWYNPNLESRWFIVPSLVAIITTIGCLIVTSLSVAREREQGTLDQVMVSPLTPGMIMAGKAVPALLVATVQATIIILAARWAYHVPFTGSMLVLYGCIVVYSVALAGFGLLISAISKTQQQAFLGVFMFMLPAILLSGFVSPVANMPAALQWISWANPLRHFIPIVTGLFLKAYTFADVLLGVAAMIVIATVTLAAAFVILRKVNS